jgi:hypothetical protein
MSQYWRPEGTSDAGGFDTESDVSDDASGSFCNRPVSWLDDSVDEAHVT